MDLRTQTSLFCSALALAIAVSVLLRGRPRRAQWFFAAFAASVGLWYLAQWLYHFVQADVWARSTAVLAVLMPQFALHLFQAILPGGSQRPLLLRVAAFLMVPMLIVVLSPVHTHPVVRVTVILYVFGLFAAGFISLLLRGEGSRSRPTQRRVRFLVLTGALAAAFSLADFLWFIGVSLPPVGAVLSIVFLFVLAESLVRQRLIDLYEMLGLALVTTALAFSQAGIFYVFVVLLGGFQSMYLNAVLGGIVMLILFEPLRDKADLYIHKVFFFERGDLERTVARVRQDLAHVFQIDEMQTIVLGALEDSRRATGAAIYLRDAINGNFRLGASFGAEAPAELDSVAAHPLIERLGQTPSIALDELAREAGERRESGHGREADVNERVVAAGQLLGPFSAGVVVGVQAEGEGLVAILAVIDDRAHEALAAEDLPLLEMVGGQIGLVFENSRHYSRMQERTRLAALGQMAAGLAHEVKNPLGAIKGAAQLLSDPRGEASLDDASREFLGIILEEVERLDRVVGSVLDYARPRSGKPGPLSVNSVVGRTLRVLASTTDDDKVEAQLGADLPAVRADAEQLRQVLINLVQNALFAMRGRTGGVRVETRERVRQARSYVEIAVVDEGPGIPPSTMRNLFVPFFTTKDRGTGLGLAISERMVKDMGGRIEVSSEVGVGSVFTVVLPAVEEPAAARAPRPHPHSPTPEAERGRGTPDLLN